MEIPLDLVGIVQLRGPTRRRGDSLCTGGNLLGGRVCISIWLRQIGEGFAGGIEEKAWGDILIPVSLFSSERAYRAQKIERDRSGI